MAVHRYPDSIATSLISDFCNQCNHRPKGVLRICNFKWSSVSPSTLTYCVGIAIIYTDTSRTNIRDSRVFRTTGSLEIRDTSDSEDIGVTNSSHTGGNCARWSLCPGSPCCMPHICVVQFEFSHVRGTAIHVT